MYGQWNNVVHDRGRAHIVHSAQCGRFVVMRQIVHYIAQCVPTLSYTSLWKYMFVGSMYEALKDDDRSFGKHFS